MESTAINENNSEVPSRLVFFIPTEDRQVEPHQQQLLLAPSDTSSGQKRKLQMGDGDNDVHHHSSQRKVYSNKRLRSNNHQQQKNSSNITSTGSEPSAKCPILYFDLAADIPTTTDAVASPKDRRVDTNISDDNAAATSKRNNIRRDDETSSNDGRFLEAFERKLTYSKAELARETKLSAAQINQLVTKYCDKVSPLSSQSKVFLKPEFRDGNLNQHQVIVSITAPILTAPVVFAAPCYFPAPENNHHIVADINEAAIREEGAVSCDLASSPSGPISDAMRVTTFRKIARKRLNEDSSIIGTLIPPITAAKKMRKSLHQSSNETQENEIISQQIQVGETGSAAPVVTKKNNLAARRQRHQNKAAAAESSESSGSIIHQPLKVSNINASFDVNCTLDLHRIAQNGRNVVYKTDKFTSAVDMKIRQPQASFRIFKSGKIVCNGTTTEKDARVAARKCTGIIQRLGFPSVKFSGFKINNFVDPFGVQNTGGDNSVSFLQRVQNKLDIHFNFKNKSDIDQELRFDGASTALTYLMTKPINSSGHQEITTGSSNKNKEIVNYSCSAVIFCNGKVNPLGAKCMADVQNAYDLICPIMEHEHQPSPSQLGASIGLCPSTTQQLEQQQKSQINHHQQSADGGEEWLLGLLDDFMPALSQSREPSSTAAYIISISNCNVAYVNSFVNTMDNNLFAIIDESTLLDCLVMPIEMLDQPKDKKLIGSGNNMPMINDADVAEPVYVIDSFLNSQASEAIDLMGLKDEFQEWFYVPGGCLSQSIERQHRQQHHRFFNVDVPRCMDGMDVA